VGRYVGHTVGLSVHDVSPPDRNRPFVAGVVFNVEPLLELPDKKIHMRLEDTVLVTPTGAVNMTAGVPAGLDEIYALIRQRALSIN
jgi:Xaa-Pro aminopeptidase